MIKNDERYLLQALQFETVLRMCLYPYTRNVSDVEPLLQETYARLLAAGSAKEPEVRSVRAIALAIARNVGSDWVRQRSVVPIELVTDTEPVDLLDEGAPIDEVSNGHRELALLVKAIQDLPERCRQIFTLRKVYGYSQKEIASRIGVAEDTVEQQLTTAARRCARALYDQPLAAFHGPLFPRLRRRLTPHARND